MAVKRCLGMVSVGAVCGSMALGQPAPEAEELEQSVRLLREQFEQHQQAYERQLDALTRQLESLQAQPESAPASTSAAAARSSDPSPAPPASGEPPLSARPWSPADPIRLLGRGNSYMNISFDALFAAGASTADDIEGGTHPRIPERGRKGWGWVCWQLGGHRYLTGGKSQARGRSAR